MSKFNFITSKIAIVKEFREFSVGRVNSILYILLDIYFNEKNKSELCQSLTSLLKKLEEKSDPHCLKYYGIYFDKAALKYFLVFEKPDMSLNYYLSFASQEKKQSILQQFSHFINLIGADPLSTFPFSEHLMFATKKGLLKVLYVGKALPKISFPSLLDHLNNINQYFDEKKLTKYKTAKVNEAIDNLNEMFKIFVFECNNFLEDKCDTVYHFCKNYKQKPDKFFKNTFIEICQCEDEEQICKLEIEKREVQSVLEIENSGALGFMERYFKPQKVYLICPNKYKTNPKSSLTTCIQASDIPKKEPKPKPDKSFLCNSINFYEFSQVSNKYSSVEKRRYGCKKVFISSNLSREETEIWLKYAKEKWPEPEGYPFREDIALSFLHLCQYNTFRSLHNIEYRTNDFIKHLYKYAKEVTN